jgi:hypothetical protein
VHAYDERASLRRDAVVLASWPVASGGEDPRINGVSLFVDEDLDHPNRVLLADIIFQAVW